VRLVKGEVPAVAAFAKGIWGTIKNGLGKFHDACACIDQCSGRPKKTLITGVKWVKFPCPKYRQVKKCGRFADPCGTTCETVCENKRVCTSTPRCCCWGWSGPRCWSQETCANVCVPKRRCTVNSCCHWEKELYLGECGWRPQPYVETVTRGSRAMRRRECKTSPFPVPFCAQAWNLAYGHIDGVHGIPGIERNKHCR
jgi:hypothetical protein